MKKINFRTWVLIIGALYFVGTMLQNILAVKTVGTETISITDCGILVSWFVFACMDIITELFGKGKAIVYFTIASVMNLITTGLLALSMALPGTDAVMSDAFGTLFQTNWRIVISSVSAFWIGNYVNAFIMFIMKARAKDKTNTFGYIARCIISSVLGQFVDNMLFYLFAFSPLGIPNTYELEWISILQNVSITTAIEVVVESCFVPLSALSIKYLRKLECLEKPLV